MNDNQKTLAFVGLAVLAVVIGWEPWRRTGAVKEDQLVEGQPLYPDFKDVSAAKSLEIVKFDEETAKYSRFSVGQTDGRWTIPSHQGYPADAKEHLADAATTLVDLEILSLVTDQPGAHAEYGVIEPDPDVQKEKATGVGMRVTFKDAQQKPLADLVVGKAEKDQPDVRYVRRAGQDQVYKVLIKTDKLSTKFEDWIEKDLLKLSTFDIRELELNDYSSRAGLTPQLVLSIRKELRSKLKLGYDDTKSAWNLLESIEYDEQNQPHETQLADDEELNTEKLNTLRSSLADLKIVDVDRKPAGLDKTLQEFVLDEAAIESLLRRGFYPVQRRDGRVEVLSSEGEVTVRLKDGVEYLVRFGLPVAGEGDKDAKAADEAAADAPAKDATKSRVNRYVFIMAQLNEDLIPKPELQPLPGEEAAAGGEAATKENEGAGDAAQPGDAPPAEPASGGNEESSGAPDQSASERSPIVRGQDADAAADAASAADETKLADEAKAADAAKADAAPPAGEDDEATKKIKKENERKQKEYDDKVKKAQDRVDELNKRFGDWYYIVSDEVYKKIHLGRADVVKPKADKDAKPATPGATDADHGHDDAPADEMPADDETPAAATGNEADPAADEDAK